MEKKIKQALDQIFSGIEILRKNFNKKPFTIDGRLVGDIGEVLAEDKYQIDLYKELKKDYDAETKDGRKVQIKATFKDSLTFKNKEGYYIGLKIDNNGIPEEIFNGPAHLIYDHFSHRKGIGKVLLSFPIKQLKEISNKVPRKEKIPERIVNLPHS